ncbi:hypothetical protein [Flavobacterium luteolum]|uniref:hypothetical protein n=1 Tax=Flavobacterium luteolum TaxID=3003259 RepID=UPI00248DF86C|nr:hypothetical protein [Flavobacterium luteolum]
MFKKLLPFEELWYHSSLSKEDLFLHLQNEIEPEKSFGFGMNRHNYSKPYIGRIFNERFEIKRAINYRNSFLPTIKGEVHNAISGSKIKIKMTIPEFAKVFMILWLGIVSIACIGVSINLIINGIDSETEPAVLIPFVMLIIGAAMVSAGFKTESKKSKKDLEEILQAKMIEN